MTDTKIPSQPHKSTPFLISDNPNPQKVKKSWGDVPAAQMTIRVWKHLWKKEGYVIGWMEKILHRKEMSQRELRVLMAVTMWQHRKIIDTGSRWVFKSETSQWDNFRLTGKNITIETGIARADVCRLVRVLSETGFLVNLGTPKQPNWAPQPDCAEWFPTILPKVRERYFGKKKSLSLV